MLVFVLLDEEAKEFDRRSERVLLVLAHFINESIEQLHELAVFALAVRHTQRLANLRPSGEVLFNLCR